MSRERSFTVHAGARAAAHLRADGLAPTDIGCVPAAAGGPKGLALIGLDRRLFDPADGWLRDARLELIGASIGAWRRHARSHPWLDNVLVVAPSAAMLELLPNRKLTDRNDFYRYGLDHAARQRDWRRAIAESERFADQVIRWLERPDASLPRPL